MGLEENPRNAGKILVYLKRQWGKKCKYKEIIRFFNLEISFIRKLF